MRNGLKILFVNIAAGIIIFFLLFYPEQMIDAAESGLLTWFNNVIPSLFPFMVTVNIITGNSSRLNFPSFMSSAFEKAFKVDGAGIIAYVFGLLSGYPLGAKISADLYFKNKIGKADVQKLIAFCCNAGPMFIVGTLACEILDTPWLGYVILISSLISNTITGMLLNRTVFGLHDKLKYSLNSCSRPENGNSSAVQNSCEALIRVVGYIILFSVISSILEILGIIDVASGVVSIIIPLEYTETKALLTGFLEMTCGINVLAGSTASLGVKAAVSSFLVSFGGISVIAQSADFLRGTGADLKLFVLSKFVNGALTSVITYISVVMILK